VFREIILHAKMHSQSPNAFIAAKYSVWFMQVPWRNGWFYDLSLHAEQEGKPDPSPTHSAWLKEVGAV